MAKYKVIYEHDVTHTYEAIVEANSDEEAFDKADQGEYLSEKEIKWQGIEVRPQSTEKLDEIYTMKTKSPQYTTGQMIDKLKRDEVAVNQDGYRAGYNEEGHLLMWEEKEDKPQIEEGNLFVIYLPWVKGDRWVIKQEKGHK